MADIQHATRKGDNMRHEETRDNTTAIEAIMMAGDAEEILVGLGHSPEAADRMVNPAKILPVIVTVDELPRLACDYPKPYNPQHVVDGWRSRTWTTIPRTTANLRSMRSGRTTSAVTSTTITAKMLAGSGLANGGVSGTIHAHG